MLRKGGPTGNQVDTKAVAEAAKARLRAPRNKPIDAGGKEGKSYRAIGAELGVSKSTVQDERARSGVQDALAARPEEGDAAGPNSWRDLRLSPAWLLSAALVAGWAAVLFWHLGGPR